jgi:hypothetical protein
MMENRHNYALQKGNVPGKLGEMSLNLPRRERFIAVETVATGRRDWRLEIGKLQEAGDRREKGEGNGACFAAKRLI